MRQAFKKSISVASMAAAMVLAASPAQAVYNIVLTETGGNVVATGSGSINTAGLTTGAGLTCSLINPSIPVLCTGTGNTVKYSGIASDPANIGSGSLTVSSSSSGDAVIVVGGNAFQAIYIKQGYVSGAPLNSTATWNATTLAGLGVTVGTYTWTFGAGANADSVVLYAGTSPNTAPAFVSPATGSLTVPESASATSITNLLHVSDTDANQTETWSLSVAPQHGTLSFSSATAASGSADITPGGSITYTPALNYAGNDSFTVQVSDGTVTAAKVISVTVTPPLPTLGSPTAQGVLSQLSVLNMANGNGPAMTNCLLTTLTQMLGSNATYQGQAANGAALIAVAGQTISFYPLSANTAGGSGLFPSGDNAMNVGTGCGTFNVAPAVSSLTDLSSALNAMGFSVLMNAQGVLMATSTANGNLYAVRPDYFVTQGTATGKPNLAFGSDGLLRFTDSTGKVQILRAAILDPVALQSAISATTSGSLAIQLDGSGVFTTISGKQTVLAPSMLLMSAPNGLGSAKLVNDQPNHYLYLIGADYQGLTATQR